MNSSELTVNVEEIMNEIRDGIKHNNPEEITCLAEALKEAEWIIQTERYSDDLKISYENIPIISLAIPEAKDCASLLTNIQNAKQTSFISAEFPVEGNALKQVFKKASQKATRCSILPLTMQINENNTSILTCLEQAVRIIDQQQQQINCLTEQLSKLYQNA